MLLIVFGISLCFAACGGAPEDAEPIERAAEGAHGACFSDADCPSSLACDTSQCLSCCKPGAEGCVAVCCGRCIPQARSVCRIVACASGFVPIDTNGDGCQNGCRKILGSD
jgi:hypothetical protein